MAERNGRDGSGDGLHSKSKADRKKPSREDRLAQALRDNLRRRKAKKD
jgi:hypothetical protein